MRIAYSALMLAERRLECLAKVFAHLFASSTARFMAATQLGITRT